jgi:hypothetical protein
MDNLLQHRENFFYLINTVTHLRLIGGCVGLHKVHNTYTKLVNQLAQEFNCQVGRISFTYLGLPLGTTRLTIDELSPLVSRLERKLTSSSSFLSQLVWLQLIDFALASMPLRFLCSSQLPHGLTN